jgi:chromosome segregation ATPase|tara:strand:- start:528 stop:800 length:273 start_codon:yes stop_codon:yes gene_type:complete
MSTTKFTEQEMQGIKEVQEEYSKVGVQLVQIKLARKNSEDYLNQLQDQEDVITQTILELSEKEKEIADTLNDKYGVGSLDMESGEFTSNK